MNVLFWSIRQQIISLSLSLYIYFLELSYPFCINYLISMFYFPVTYYVVSFCNYYQYTHKLHHTHSLNLTIKHTSASLTLDTTSNIDICILTTLINNLTMTSTSPAFLLRSYLKQLLQHNQRALIRASRYFATSLYFFNG